MSVKPLQDQHQRLPQPRGHAIGFVDTESECDSVTEALNAAGFSDSKILVLSGEDGIHLLERMMKGYLFGESDDEVMHSGVTELQHGHFVLCIEVADRDEAVQVAAISTEHGGYHFTHFGLWADERLTA